LVAVASPLFESPPELGSAIGPVVIDNGVSPRVGSGTFVFTSGTGRFENVTGGGEWGVTYYEPPTIWMDAEINY